MIQHRCQTVKDIIKIARLCFDIIDIFARNNFWRTLTYFLTDLFDEYSIYRILKLLHVLVVG